MEHQHLHQHDHEEDSSSKEFLALLRYMVGHNEAHTKELEELASNVEAAKGPHVAEHISLAIEAYEKGNESLKAALEHLEGK